MGPGEDFSSSLRAMSHADLVGGVVLARAAFGDSGVSMSRSSSSAASAWGGEGSGARSMTLSVY